MRCHNHDAAKSGAEDGVLAEIQQGQAGAGLQAGRFVLFQRIVVPVRLVFLVVEILDGFVVDQRIYRLVSGLILRLVHEHAELRSPLSDAQRVQGVHAHATE